MFLLRFIYAKRTRWNFILVGILILAAVGGYFIYTNYSNNRTKPVPQNPVPTSQVDNKPVSPDNPEGWSCGKLAGPGGDTTCPLGYTCDYSNSPNPDIGTCIKGKQLDESANWKTYKDTASTLSFDYPQDWNLIEGPKQVKEEVYDYEYLKLNGKEGEITIMRANQLGGGCGQGYEKIKLKNVETDTCHYTDNQGLENWSLYLNNVNGGGTLDLFATVNKPILTNRSIIVKILSSINF